MKFYKPYRIFLSGVFFILSLSIAGFYLFQVYKTWNTDAHIEEIYKYNINYQLDSLEGLKHGEIFSTDNKFDDLLKKLVKAEPTLTISTANKSENYYYANKQEIPNSIDQFDPNFGTKILTFFVLFLVAGILVLPPIGKSTAEGTNNGQGGDQQEKPASESTTPEESQSESTDSSKKTK